MALRFCMIALVGGVALVDGHMQMSQPYPLRSPLNPQQPWDLKDYDMTSPLNADGSNFPCKGYQKNTPLTPTAQYTAGNSYTMSLSGSATHLGGSCQLSLSYDNGASFHVIKSIIGGCPTMSLSYDFTIPATAATGLALFAWSWNNFEGNREFYMNCAVVQISAPSTYTSQPGPELPSLFVANLAGINSCVVPEATDAVYPNPGSDVQYGNGESSASIPFAGSCGYGPEVGTNQSQVGGAPTPVITSAVALASATDTPPYEDQRATPIATSFGSTEVPSMTAAYTPQATPGEFYVAGSAVGNASISTTMLTVYTSRTSPSSAATPTNAGPISVDLAALYVSGDPNTANPGCKAGAILCTSRTAFVTCEPATDPSGAAGWAYGPKQSTGSGMICLPRTLAGSRDDQYVRDQPYGPCSSEGALQCVSDGHAFQMCAQGAWVDMGSVADGTLCTNSAIVASL